MRALEPVDTLGQSRLKKLNLRCPPTNGHSWRRYETPNAAVQIALARELSRERVVKHFGSYGCPRITMAPKEAGLHAGWRRVGCLIP